MGVSRGQARAGSGQRSCVDDSRAGGGLSTVVIVGRGVAGVGGNGRGCGRGWTLPHFADGLTSVAKSEKPASGRICCVLEK